MMLSYFDVISMVYYNYDYITSEDTIYTLFGRGNLKDVTTAEDQDPDFPIPHYTRVFHFVPKEAYLGILEVNFSTNNRLLNTRVLLHFGSFTQSGIARQFYESNLLPYVRKEVGMVESAPNPAITGHTFWPKNLEVTARWVSNMPSVATYLTLLDQCNMPS